jgi:hypothetical protein
MAWHFDDHGRFQRDAAVLVAAGGGTGAVTWAAALPSAGWWVSAAVGLALGALVRQARRGKPPAPGESRRGWLAVAGAAVAGAALATGVWLALAPALAITGDLPAPAEAAVLGLVAALVACLALAAAHLTYVGPKPLVEALGQARAALTGAELALGERAVAAHDRVVAGLAADRTAEARRLSRLSEDVAVQVLGLATRCHGLRDELADIDLGAARRRAATLAAAAARSGEGGTRDDLARAARAVVALDERVSALAGARMRVHARLELQVALLEGTALAVAARQASVTADQAGALTPLADRLHEAAGDLDTEALALAEVGAIGRDAAPLPEIGPPEPAGR